MEILAQQTESKDAVASEEAVPTFRKKFELRCWARARLCNEGELNRQRAVDELQLWAQELGLIDQLGQDEVQLILAENFGVL